LQAAGGVTAVKVVVRVGEWPYRKLSLKALVIFLTMPRFLGDGWGIK
jgi:hypothetical protein